MATLSNPAYEATTPVVEYNLSNEATTVRRTIPGPAAPSTIEYGDWGLVSGDGTVDYDFTVSDSQLLFLESAGNIRHDIMRERIDDRTKKGMFSLIQSYAVDDLVHEIRDEESSVDEKIEHIENLLTQGTSVTWIELFKGCRSKDEVLCCFLAILELCRIGRVRAHQHRAFGDIKLYGLEDSVHQRCGC